MSKERCFTDICKKYMSGWAIKQQQTWRHKKAEHYTNEYRNSNIERLMNIKDHIRYTVDLEYFFYSIIPYIGILQKYETAFSAEQ